MVMLKTTHEELSPSWVKIIMEYTMLFNIWYIIEEFREENDIGFQDIEYTISDKEIKLYYRDILLREYINGDTEIKCYFEGSSLFLDDAHQLNLGEALKQINTGKGECPERLPEWSAPAGAQRGNIQFLFSEEFRQDLKAIYGIDFK